MTLKCEKGFEAFVIGVSAGGLEALETILRELPVHFPLAGMIVQHRSKQNDNFLSKFLNGICHINVQEAEEKILIQPGNLYIAPPDYHLQVEMDRTLSLTVDPLVHWSRPSVDVLFETAAEVYQDRLVGVILTGANQDGSAGLKKIKQFGGTTIVQDPETAVASEMPQSAINKAGVDHILTLQEIGRFLAGLKNPEDEIQDY